MWMCYKCKVQHLKLRNDCPVCRAPAPQLDALAARNEAIARGSYNFHGQRWPEIGEFVVKGIAAPVNGCATPFRVSDVTVNVPETDGMTKPLPKIVPAPVTLPAAVMVPVSEVFGK